ncbi:hypothetical protein, partial [Hydrogenimonas sp.]|uniref:hypothetical protein n=1 Tax=Hydrogenimonas sp. TaxID=2231112 RepID=UPI00260C6EC2
NGGRKRTLYDSRFPVHRFSIRRNNKRTFQSQSGLVPARGRELVSEDFAEVRVIGDFFVGIVCEDGRAARRTVGCTMNDTPSRGT